MGISEKNEGSSRKLYGQQENDGKRSDSVVLESNLFSTIAHDAPARKETNGDRFLEALKERFTYHMKQPPAAIFDGRRFLKK